MQLQRLRVPQSASWAPRRANMDKFQSESQQAQGPRRDHFSVQSQGKTKTKTKTPVSAQTVKWKDIPKVFSWLDKAHPHGRKPPPLLSLLIQTLILPRNTLTKTPSQRHPGQMSGCPTAQSSWHIKLNIPYTKPENLAKSYSFHMMES